jgi:hypothetical protein
MGPLKNYLMPFLPKIKRKVVEFLISKKMNSLMMMRRKL